MGDFNGMLYNLFNVSNSIYGLDNTTSDGVYTDTLGSKGGAGITLADDVSGGNHSLTDVSEFDTIYFVQAGNASNIQTVVDFCRVRL